MSEHKWAPPEHQDVPIYAAESLPLSAADRSQALFSTIGEAGDQRLAGPGSP